MPRAWSSAERRLSSVHFELPPSTIASPGSSRSASFFTVCSVASPAGTMIHTSLGACSFCTSSSSEPAPVAPFSTAFPTASASKSNATTSCSESRRMRWTMLPPILPRPTKPICIRTSSMEGEMGWRHSSSHHLLDLVCQCAQRRRRVIASQAHALGGQAQLALGLQLHDRLGVLERGERVRLPRYLLVRRPVVDQLQ